MAEATKQLPQTTLRELNPKYAAASDKLAELIAREEAILQQMAPIRNRLADAGVLGSISQNTPKPPDLKIAEPHGPSAAAKTLLGDIDIAHHLAEIERPKPRPEHPELPEFERLGAELHAVIEALAVIRGMRPGVRHSLLEREHLEASRAYCETIRPEYSKLAAAYCDALLALGEAGVALHEFQTEKLRGVAWSSLRPIQMSQFLGDALDPTSEIRRILAWAAEVGHFDSARLPERWVQRNRPAADVHSWPKLFKGSR